ncbi:hypothetical protein CF327_g4423 [Tilletia walkeri]|nr:hypothetical protein CF327_g4423 [Tilletia walkeri]
MQIRIGEDVLASADIKTSLPTVRITLIHIRFNLDRIVSITEKDEETRPLSRELADIIHVIVSDFAANVNDPEFALSPDSHFSKTTRQIESVLSRILDRIRTSPFPLSRLLSPKKRIKNALIRATKDLRLLVKPPPSVQSGRSASRYDLPQSLPDSGMQILRKGFEACKSDIPIVAVVLSPVLCSLREILSSVEGNEDDLSAATDLTIEILVVIQYFVALFKGTKKERNPDFAFDEKIQKLADDLFGLLSEIRTFQSTADSRWRIRVGHNSISDMINHGREVFKSQRSQVELDVLWERYTPQTPPWSPGLTLGDANKAIVIGEWTVEAYEGLLKGDAAAQRCPGLASALREQADRLWARNQAGDQDKAIATWERRIEVLEGLLEEGDTAERRADLADALEDQADDLWYRNQSGDLDTAIVAGERCIEVLEGLPKEEATAERHEILAFALEHQALRLWYRDQSGDWDRAIVAGERRIAVFEGLLTEEDTAERREDLASALQDQADNLWYRNQPGDRDRAILTWERRIQVLEGLLKEEATAERRAALASALGDRANHLWYRNQSDDRDRAIVAGERRIEMLEGLPKEEATAEGRAGLASALKDQAQYLFFRNQSNDRDRAIVTWERRIEVLEGLLEEGDTAERRADLASALGEQANHLWERNQPGDLDTAIVAGERCIEVLEGLPKEEATAERHEILALALEHQALRLWARNQSGDRKRAIETYERRIKVLGTLLEEDATAERLENLDDAIQRQAERLRIQSQSGDGDMAIVKGERSSNSSRPLRPSGGWRQEVADAPRHPARRLRNASSRPCTPERVPHQRGTSYQRSLRLLSALHSRASSRPASPQRPSYQRSIVSARSRTSSVCTETLAQRW